MKNGNKKKFQSSGGIGLISSRITLEGPIKKDTASFIISGRRTYFDIFAKPFVDTTSFAGSSYYFYDLTTKANYQISAKDKIFLSGYFGRDVFDISNLFNNAYGNSVANFRWNHLFSNQLFSYLSLIYSDYDYRLDFSFADFEWNSSIVNMNLKYAFKHYLSEKIKLEYSKLLIIGKYIFSS